MKQVSRVLATFAFAMSLFGCGGGELIRSDDAEDSRARAQSIDPSCIETITVNVGSTNSEPPPSESSGGDATTGANNSGTHPDLVIIELSLEDAAHNPIETLHINTSARCRMRLKNQGTANAGAFRTSCYISDGLKTDDNPQDMAAKRRKASLLAAPRRNTRISPSSTPGGTT